MLYLVLVAGESDSVRSAVRCSQKTWDDGDPSPMNDKFWESPHHRDANGNPQPTTMPASEIAAAKLLGHTPETWNHGMTAAEAVSKISAAFRGRAVRRAYANHSKEKEAEEPNQEAPHENGTVTGGAALIELVFNSIDADKSGQLSSAEFSQWWLANGGDEDRLKTLAQAFDIISKRDGKPGCSPAEFKELIVASIQEDWEEKFDEDLKPYYKHVKTGESSREDANERCATIL